MLNALLAHTGLPPAPHDLWSAWNLDPPVLVGLGVAAVLYRRGTRHGRGRGQARRDGYFWFGLAALAVALVSPLEPWSGALASAHMVQHLLLILVAAPLLALSAPSSALLRGAPVGIRRVRGWLRGHAPGTARRLRAPSHPAVVWLLHVGALWWWHGAASYDVAVQYEWLHAAEHVTFVVTAVWFWRVVLGPRAGSRVPEGLGLLLVFGMAMQSVFLSVLLTFSREAWYGAYAQTTQAWGLTPLADQQLAGVLMWVPAGAIYLACGLVLLTRWMRRAGGPSAPTPVDDAVDPGDPVRSARQA